MVNGHRQRGAQTAARFTNAFEFHRQIEVRFGEEVGPCSARLPGFKLQAIAHTAGVIFEDLAGSGAERQLPDARILHPAGEAHQLGASIFAGGNVLVPLDAVGEDRWHVAQGFYVVDAGRLAPDAGARRERRLGSRVGAAAFQRVDQRRLFAADIAPCPGVHEQLEVKPGAEDVFPQQTRFGGFSNRATQMLGRFNIFPAQEDVAAVRFQRKRGDQHAFHQQVRQLLHQQAVFIGARLHFIGVTQQVTDVHGFVFRHQAPLQTSGEARAAAPFQASVFYRRDNLIRGHPGQGFTRPFIAIFTAILVQPHRLLVVAQAPGERMRFRSTNYGFHLYCSSRSGIASGVRWL
ncbi:hypothetical protein UUU_29730 [Klebsiella pneumoniae subsp. pneumoniae DSM 30104 = JCM 1662 = NBRC 14940]|nr:hypothetical protein UUU_29730 [Klebsiella pneumoniae subsp. pneumoniae DSM 30104 = JCM 1662 = NBRC 14940]